MSHRHPQSGASRAVLGRGKMPRLQLVCVVRTMTTTPDQVSALRRLLIGPDDAIARQAARDLGRMKSKAIDAIDDLVAAATMPWQLGCPQRFSDAAEAILKIAPSDPRLVPIIRETISCSNYGVQKVCVLGLLTIGTAAAVETFYHIDQYWRASPKSLAFKKLMYRAVGELEERGLDKLVPNSHIARAQLVDWLEDRQQGPACPNCGEPLRTAKAQQCFRCGANWNDQPAAK